jgi:hypothetical protein
VSEFREVGARNGIVKSIVGLVGDDVDAGEAIISDGDGQVARELGTVRESADLGHIHGS